MSDKINELDVKMTAEAIDEMAKQFDHYAEELRTAARKMRERKDIEYASEAMHVIRSCFSNIRIDLLVVRPMRAFQRLLRD